MKNGWVVAPNAFRESLRCDEVAEAMRAGIIEAAPAAPITVLPQCDGGDGTLECLHAHVGAAWRTCIASDALGRRVNARFLVGTEGTAVIEAAEACGLRRVAVGERDPLRASSRGVGELITAALDAGARNIVVGAGGTAVLDCGIGMLVAMGAVCRNGAGKPIEELPIALFDLVELDTSSLDGRLSGAKITVMSDFRVPLSQNAAATSHAKGIRSEHLDLFAEIVRRFDTCARRRGISPTEIPWFGAGGGLSAALACFAGANVLSGAEFCADLSGLRAAAAAARYVMTGEGQFDETSLQGKAPYVTAQIALSAGALPVLIAGRVCTGTVTAAGFYSHWSLVDEPETMGFALADPRSAIATAASRIAHRLHSQ